jgi:hypothetical protein
MPVALYMDQHVPRAITTGLRLRGIDVLTALEDGASDVDDPELLDRASAGGCSSPRTTICSPRLRADRRRTSPSAA